MAGCPGRLVRAPVLVLAALLVDPDGAACTTFPGQRGGARAAEVRPHGAPQPTEPAAPAAGAPASLLTPRAPAARQGQAAEDVADGAAPGGGGAAQAAGDGLPEARAEVAELAAAGAIRVLVAGAAGLGPGDEVRITGPAGSPQDKVVVGSVQPGGASLVVEATGAIEAGGEGLWTVALTSPLQGSFPAGSSVVKLARTMTTMRREARPIAALDADGPATLAGPAPKKPAPTIMRWAWTAPGPAPAMAPPGGWVHVTPEEHSQKKVPTRPEDTAFLYYQFEPTELRGGGHVIEIAELELLNNGQKVDMSGATASTPSSLVHWQGFPLSLLIDGNASSVWVDDWLEPITVRLPQPASADGFGFITGTVPDRDPAKWKFRGSADGVRWTTLHSQVDDLHEDAKRLELHRFVFGETEPRAPTAPTGAPTEVAGAGATAAGATGAGAAGAGAAATASGSPASEQAVSASDSLLNSTWSPADDKVTAESAAASRQAVVESAERKFEEAAGESQRKKEEEGSPEPALVASLSTIGVLLLLAAGVAVAYNVLSRPVATVPPGKGDPLLSEGEEGSDRGAAPSGNPTGL